MGSTLVSVDLAAERQSTSNLTDSSIADTKYPTDRPAESIAIKVLGGMYEIKTQYHVVENITYVLLDAPIFRQQTKAEPYPTRMDDLESAVYYSAWNSCIAEVMGRFPIDLCKFASKSTATLGKRTARHHVGWRPRSLGAFHGSY